MMFFERNGANMCEKIEDFLITYLLLFICCLMDLKAINFQTFIRPLVLTVAYTLVGYCISYISDHDKKSKSD